MNSVKYAELRHGEMCWQEEMDVEEKRNVNIIVHYYTIIHISRFFKAKKTGARPNMNLAQLLRDVLF